MQSYDEAVEIAVREGRSLSDGERKKALGPYDAIYICDRIQHHNRRLNLRRGALLLLYVALFVAVYTVFFYPDDNPTSQVWLKGTVAMLTVLSVLGIPFLVTNHGRNASILRMVSRLRGVEHRAAGGNAGSGQPAAASPRGGAREAKE